MRNRKAYESLIISRRLQMEMSPTEKNIHCDSVEHPLSKPLCEKWCHLWLSICCFVCNCSSEKRGWKLCFCYLWLSADVWYRAQIPYIIKTGAKNKGKSLWVFPRGCEVEIIMDIGEIMTIMMDDRDISHIWTSVVSPWYSPVTARIHSFVYCDRDIHTSAIVNPQWDMIDLQHIKLMYDRTL